MRTSAEKLLRKGGKIVVQDYYVDGGFWQVSPKTAESEKAIAMMRRNWERKGGSMGFLVEHEDRFGPCCPKPESVHAVIFPFVRSVSNQ